ncbi:MAG: VOC family protein [Myxococcota bacterium]
MQPRGMNHFGLMTHDIDTTIEFYQKVLGFEPIAYYLREVGEGHLRQVFFDLGNSQSLEFAQSHGIADIADTFDAGINAGLGVRTGVGMIHFAFDVDSLEELEARKSKLEAAGVDVIGPLDLDWLHSIYFRDPNGVQLEFSYTVKSVPGESYLEPVNTEKWRELKAEAASRAS